MSWISILSQSTFFWYASGGRDQGKNAYIIDIRCYANLWGLGYRRFQLTNYTVVISACLSFGSYTFGGSFWKQTSLTPMQLDKTTEYAWGYID
eukprot:6455434-Pyramimonas_sp.AAC.1